MHNRRKGDRRAGIRFDRPVVEITVMLIHEYGDVKMAAAEPVVAEGHKTIDEMMDLLVERDPQPDQTKESYRNMMNDSFEKTILRGVMGIMS